MARLSLQCALAKARKTRVTGEKIAAGTHLSLKLSCGKKKKREREKSPWKEWERIHIKDFIAYDKLLLLT